MKSERLTIFKTIKPLLKRYQPPLVARSDYEGRYELWSEKEVIIDGRKRKDVFFASLIIQSNYVGFYFMPVYTDKDIKRLFAIQLLKLLKGKSCFHIKHIDSDLMQAIDHTLDQGFDLYKQRGWV